MLEYRITEADDSCTSRFRLTANGRAIASFSSVEAAANTARLLGMCDHVNGEDVLVTFHAATADVRVLDTIMGDARAYAQVAQAG
jgi:hypothetical protein